MISRPSAVLYPVCTATTLPPPLSFPLLAACGPTSLAPFVFPTATTLYHPSGTYRRCCLPQL